MITLKCPVTKRELDYALSCRVFVKTDQPKRFKRLPKPKFKYVPLLTEKPEEKPSKDNKRKKKAKEPVTKSIIVDRRTRSGKMNNHFQNTFEEYVKKKTKATSYESQQKIKKPKKPKTYSGIKKPKPSPEIKELVVNTKTPVKPIKENKEDTYYFLDLSSNSIGKKPFPMLDYPFENLAKDAKFMKLPSLDWKIKIMVHKQEMICVGFNYCANNSEKSVMVQERTKRCELLMSGRKIQLIGCPLTISCIEDMEILLDIMHNLSPDSNYFEFL